MKSENEYLIISFSGGRTSAFMTKYIQSRQLEPFGTNRYQLPTLVIFANTGKERPETLDFINECDKRWGLNVIWLEADIKKEGTNTFKVVDYKTASRDGEPFEKMIQRYGVPNIKFPHCTRELKSNVISKFLKSAGIINYTTAVGIRADEPKRLKWDKFREKKWIVPLADEFRVNSDYVRKWWQSQDFDLKLNDYEGNCDMCWKKSDRKIATLIRESPELIEWWNDMEIKYGENERGIFTFFRNNRDAQDMIALSKDKRVRSVIDKNDLNKIQLTAFDIDLDYELYCHC